ncbi:MAG: transcription repressor NadR [Caldicoprobacterales bacterium]|nr:transcription repressor NadR [Clostridiales bacterium]
MTSEERREKIIVSLERSNSPLTGSYLAKLYNVSRQVIVQDIAILRAAGYDIIATPQGYLIPRASQPRRITRVFAVKHGTDDIKDELNTIVDHGGRILDVIIEHPVYGEFKASLMMSSRSDVSAYLAAMQKLEAEPLSKLTEGVHLHTVEADSIVTLNQIEKALEQKGYLLS